MYDKIYAIFCHTWRFRGKPEGRRPLEIVGSFLRWGCECVRTIVDLPVHSLAVFSLFVLSMNG